MNVTSLTDIIDKNEKTRTNLTSSRKTIVSLMGVVLRIGPDAKIIYQIAEIVCERESGAKEEERRPEVHHHSLRLCRGFLEKKLEASGGVVPHEEFVCRLKASGYRCPSMCGCVRQ